MKELKNALSILIKDLSEAMDSEMKAIDKDVLVKMVNKLVELIYMSKLPKTSDFYVKIFRKIMNGEVQIYRLNVINLMIIFNSAEFKILPHEKPLVP